MKILLRTLGVTVGVFFIVVFASMTFTFIRNVWFGNLRGTPDRVAVIEVSGLLTSSKAKLKELRGLLEEPSNKAIVLRVNSPGGLVAPSQELYEAFKKADKKVPVIVSMGPLAASGGYYISLGGRKIFANAGTLTASIGVIIEFVNLQKLYQWAKVERFPITAGKFKATGSPMKPLTPAERQLLEDLVNNIHGQFKSAVAERRGLTEEEMRDTTDGRVMTGDQAHKAKLVDAIGTLEDAIVEARKIANLDEDAPVYYNEPKPGLLQKYLVGEEVESALSSVSANFIAPAMDNLGWFSPGWRVTLVSPVR